MIYATEKNKLANWYRASKRRALKNNSPICDEWKTWRGFAEWCKVNGYDENSKLFYSARNPFSPEYLFVKQGGKSSYVKRPPEHDWEYIAYKARDPYELIISSAPSVTELSANLLGLGYVYDEQSILASLSRNNTDRPVDERHHGLIFERVDLFNYNEDDEPFEERN